MSQANFISNILNIKDKNIIFEKEFYTEEVIKGVGSKVFHGKLTYTPKACSNCGVKFDKDIIKHGFKTSRIKIPDVSNFASYLMLKKQRYLCRHCNSTFTLSTNVVNKYCFISSNTKLSIALNARDKISEKDIALRHNVSASTVRLTIDNFYQHYKPKFNYLPQHLCFDEFKSVKSASGAMSFIFCNAESGQIVDIVEDRRLYRLRNYFLKYSKAARRSVKTVVIDIFSPYMSLVKEMFPRAKILIDKFHIIQLLSRSLNKTRIRVMNRNKDNYNKLKKYWKLLLKDTSKLNYSTYRYHRSFKKPMREIDIVNYLIALDPELKDTYELYHNIRYAIESKNIDLFNELITHTSDKISNYMKISIKTLNKYKDYVSNTFNHTYTNGVLEGLINKIKVIKRIAFGFRNFFHFRSRILITQNLARLKA